MRHQESELSEQPMCICAYEYIWLFYRRRAHRRVRTHVLYKAQHLFKGLPLLGSSTALSVLIFPRRQQNKGPMRTTIREPGWDHCDHGREELPGACTESLPSSNLSMPGMWKLWEDAGWSLSGPCLMGTGAWDTKLLKSNTSEARCFMFWRVCMVNCLLLERSHCAKYQIPVLKHKAFKSLKDKTTRILNLGRTTPLLVF